MDILHNVQFQQAVVTLLALLITAFGKWLQLKFSQKAIVNDLWCYAQPAVNYSLGLAEAAIKEGALNEQRASEIIAASAAEFIKNFNKFEGSEPSQRQVNAILTELAKAIGASIK